MKKIVSISLVLGILLLSAFTFAYVGNSHNVKKHTTVKKKAKKPECVATITSVTLVSVTSSSATITFTYSGNPDHFEYGGYYNLYNVTIPATNLYTTTLVLPLGGTSCGARIWFKCACSDGTLVGTDHGVLFGCGDSTIYF